LALFVEFLVLVSAERARFLDLDDEEIDQLIVGLTSGTIGSTSGPSPIPTTGGP
jgi:hypothetical protein